MGKRFVDCVAVALFCAILTLESMLGDKCMPKEIKRLNGANKHVTEHIEKTISAHTSKESINISKVSANITEKHDEPEDLEDLEDELYFDSLETLAICVEAEAGNQDLYGKRLVVDVILNRVDSPRFPDSIEDVISQYRQFSTYWNGGMSRIKEPSEETFETVRLELDQRTDRKILFFTAGQYNIYCRPAYKYQDHYFGY